MLHTPFVFIEGISPNILLALKMYTRDSLRWMALRYVCLLNKSYSSLERRPGWVKDSVPLTKHPFILKTVADSVCVGGGECVLECVLLLFMSKRIPYAFCNNNNLGYIRDSPLVSQQSTWALISFESPEILCIIIFFTLRLINIWLCLQWLIIGLCNLR